MVYTTFKEVSEKLHAISSEDEEACKCNGNIKDIVVFNFLVM
jgi:hypothetical protein